MLRIGFMGAGSIAHKMAVTVTGMNQEVAQVCAVGARDLERAREFAARYHIEKAYGSYEDLLADPDIDLIYIGTPHSHHARCMKQCLEAGKHVLCEKPFTVTRQEAEEIFALAAEKHLFVTEALWTRYMPSRKMIDDIIKSGVIGEVTSLIANLGYELSQVKRIWDPNLAGGALLDVGVYLIHFARMIFGEDITSISSDARFSQSGVDYCDSLTINFAGDRQAVLHCNVKAVLNRNGSVFGTKGYLEVVNINNPEKILVFDENYQQVAAYDVPQQITGYEYEVEASAKAVAQGQLECSEISHQETLEVLAIMDQLRKDWGYEIPVLK